jgi:RHS repeat-associated protein
VNGYDELGRQTTRHDGDGTLLVQWQYDTATGGIGMLAKATRWHDGEAYVNETLQVNGQGLVTLAAVSIPASEGRLAGRRFFGQTYAPNGLIASQGLPGVGELEQGVLNWAYDHVGNPTRLTYRDESTGTTVIVDDATFTPYNEIQTRRLGAGNARHAYHGFAYEEDTRRLSQATFGREASIHSLANVRYRYDDAGNVLSIADQPEDLPGGDEVQCFRYDNQRRLVEAWAQGGTGGCASSPSRGVLGGPAPYWHTYDHDITGNRTAETLRAPGRPAVTRSYHYPAAGQPQPHAVQQVSGSGAPPMSFDYDASGNTVGREVDGRTQNLDWDTEGRIETVEESGEDTVRMVYDADGNRLIRDDGDTVTAFLPQTELTWDRATDTVEGTRYFSHAGQVVAICAGRDVADWTFLGVDRHGTTTTHSVNAFTGVEQVRRMDSYGNPRGPAPQTWPGQQGFVGGVQDPTGLTHIGARSYDPVIGRFLSVDPVLDPGDDQQINGYEYANNNPVTWSDPTGLRVCADVNCNQAVVPPGNSPRTKSGGGSSSTGGSRPKQRVGGMPDGGGGLPAVNLTFDVTGGDDGNDKEYPIYGPQPWGRGPAPEPWNCEERRYGERGNFCAPYPDAPWPPPPPSLPPDCEPQRYGNCKVFDPPDRTGEKRFRRGSKSGPRDDWDTHLSVFDGRGWYLSVESCQVVCIAASGTVEGITFSGGGFGTKGPSGSFGWNDAPASAQQPMYWSACATYGVGMCGQTGLRNDGSRWFGEGVAVGGLGGRAGPMWTAPFVICPWCGPPSKALGSV